MADWSTAFQNNLPDSSFFWIEPGGKKDSEGKTVPRSLRHLPYKDGSGKVDMPHLNNAKSRINQVQNMPASVKARILEQINRLQSQNQHSLEDELKEKGWLSSVSIKLDANGELPTRIPLLITGDWENSVKGNFSVDLDDLYEIKQHYDEKIGFPTEDATTGLAIDKAHDYAHEAAGWMKGFEVEVDPNDTSKGTLFANPVEWTDIGENAIKSGQYKCISPMGFFGRKAGKLSMWSNPTNLKEKVANVIEGAGLTNIPFLRGMQPIRADRTGHLTQDFDNVIYVYDLKQKTKEPSSMNIDELRVKDREDLTVPELDYLTEQKSQLDKEELAKFQLDEGEEEGNEDQLSEEDKQTLSAIKAGTKKVVDAGTESVEKTQLDALQATADQYRTEKAAAVVEAHVKRGAIKQDSTEFWTKQLLSADGEGREALEKQLEALPSNEQLAGEIGTGEDVNAGSTAREQLDTLAKQKVAEAAKAGKELLYADALKQVYREQEDLRTQDRQEQLAKAGA